MQTPWLRAGRLAGRGRLGEAAQVFGRAVASLATDLPKMPLPLPGVSLPKAPTRAAPAVPAGAQFLELAHRGPHGARPYRLYLPASRRDGPAPLVVMLHGCTQDALDFARGTGMNRVAEAAGCLVAWPEQIAGANPQRCWNWFRPEDQRRDAGEPALLAGLIREVMARHDVDPRRVYVAGLSAGGAASVVLGQTYPDLVAAVGVHSGLARGVAHDGGSAFAAMRHGGRPASGVPIPTIVFQGDADRVVSPLNADAVASQAARDQRGGDAAEVSHGTAPGGHAWVRTVRDGGRIELWHVRGAGHAWSGGDAAGSFTDPLGPDASAEMLRFFLAHPRS